MMRILIQILLLSSIAKMSYAQNIKLDVGEEAPEPSKLILPYVLHTESLDTAYGVFFGGSGHFQPQASVFATAFATTNDTVAGFIGMQDIQFPFAKRLFLTLYGSKGDYTNQLVYTGFNSAFPGERSGSNNSDNDNNIQGLGKDDWLEFNFRYLLPTGHAKNNSINKYHLKNGLLSSGETGGNVWDPMKSGRVNLEFTLFKRSRSFLNEDTDIRGKTTGVRYAIEYDNRDFNSNPSKGSLQRFSVSQDYGWADSTDEWSAVQLDLRKYFSFGATNSFRQQVLALNFWTSYSPSWQLVQTPGGPAIDGQSPSYLGSALGGYTRLRSYPAYRYSDKAAIYYAAEYRIIPRWNPFNNSKLFKFLEIDWIQVVPFVEFGRVAPEWSASTLHSDMKKVVGLGLRMMAKKAVFRLDTAYSEDSWSMWAMVGHPF